MKNVLISATLSATLGLSAFSSLAQDVDLRMSWWGGNGRHQVTLKALEEFHKQNPDINVKAEYTGWDGNWNTVKLAVDRGGLQFFGVELAEVDLVFQGIQIVKAIAIFRKDRQPVPVGLHHVRLGTAGNLGGQA